MRAVDDDTEMKVAILRKLQHWGKLPESDLSRMLRQYHLITDDFRDMEEEGLIEMRFVGDEYVVGPTVFGRLFLEQQEQEEQTLEEPPDTEAEG
ncbi:MAG TPA: hypothetical protein VH590_03285 [Ktedonobacterales bacterium]|jgi:hypothetical protein